MNQERNPAEFERQEGCGWLLESELIGGNSIQELLKHEFIKKYHFMTIQRNPRLREVI